MDEILFVCQCSYLNSAKHNSPLASQKPKRVASMMVRKFNVSTEKWIHFEMRDSYKIPKLKKSYELSFFTGEKSLCEFHFPRFTLPGTSGESSTFTFITSHWIHLERKKTHWDTPALRGERHCMLGLLGFLVHCLSFWIKTIEITRLPFLIWNWPWLCKWGILILLYLYCSILYSANPSTFKKTLIFSMHYDWDLWKYCR